MFKTGNVVAHVCTYDGLQRHTSWESDQFTSQRCRRRESWVTTFSYEHPMLLASSLRHVFAENNGHLSIHTITIPSAYYRKCRPRAVNTQPLNPRTAGAFRRTRTAGGVISAPDQRSRKLRSVATWRKRRWIG